MDGQHSSRMDPLPESAISILGQLFATDPAVGFSICDVTGKVLYLNERSAEIFLKSHAADAVGKTLHELLGDKWANERLEMFKRIQATGKPIISRHILHGVQVQSTIRPLTEVTDDRDPVFSVMSIEGLEEPADPADFDIVESKLMHLGHLDALTRREIEVLALIGHGMTSKEIAGVLHRSVRTIEQHCDSIRQKLKGASRIQIAQFAHTARLELRDAELTRL